MSNWRYYTGVGSRSTPTHVLNTMTAIARKFNTIGYTLRSGGAKGADSAFELGAGNDKEIYYANDANDSAIAIASKFHPAWNKCSAYAKKLHGRNAFQVLGKGLNMPSSYCICWTPDGCISNATRQYKTGGTGTAISISEFYGVPVVNLCIPQHFEIWELWSRG